MEFFEKKCFDFISSLEQWNEFHVRTIFFRILQQMYK